MQLLQPISLFLSILLTALIAGLLYGYSSSVNPGLGALPDVDYLKAMQSINKAILNPFFFLSFMGSLIILPVTVFLFYSQPLTPRFYCLTLSALFYIFGVFAVTLMCNVPLNETLARFTIDQSTAAEISAQRLSFELPWNKFHLIRTIAAICSLTFLIVAAVIKSPA